MAYFIHRHRTMIQIPGHPELARLATPSYQAFRILHVGYFLLPLIAGLDKFTDLLADWDRYLAPAIPNLLGISAHTFMMGVGVIEILAAVVVLIAPEIGAWVVGAWLAGIMVNLLLDQSWYDVALRDFGLLLGAVALARLAYAHRDVTVGRSPTAI